MLYRGTYEGGCLCGAIRYAFIDVFDAGYCHCSICRRASPMTVRRIRRSAAIRAGGRRLRATC